MSRIVTIAIVFIPNPIDTALLAIEVVRNVRGIVIRHAPPIEGSTTPCDVFAVINSLSMETRGSIVSMLAAPVPSSEHRRLDEMNSELRRLECLKVAVSLYANRRSFEPEEMILEAAQKFETFVRGSVSVPEIAIQPEVSIVYDKIGNLVTSSDDFPVDLTSYTLSLTGEAQHVHLPRQHRDGKPPWCDICGLTKELLPPKAKFRE